MQALTGIPQMGDTAALAALSPSATLPPRCPHHTHTPCVKGKHEFDSVISFDANGSALKQARGNASFSLN